MLNCILDSCHLILLQSKILWPTDCHPWQVGQNPERFFLKSHAYVFLSHICSLSNLPLFSCLVLFFSSKFKTCTLNLVWRSPNVTLTSKLQIVFLLLRYSSIPWTEFKESLAHFPPIATYLLFNVGYGAQCCSLLLWLSWLHYDHVACCTSKTRRHGSCC
jgi:hypothetical protein